MYLISMQKCFVGKFPDVNAINLITNTTVLSDFLFLLFRHPKEIYITKTKVSKQKNKSQKIVVVWVKWCQSAK